MAAVSRLRKAVTRGMSLKVYVVLWVGMVILSCVLLAGSWLAANTRLLRMNRRIFADARALDAGRLLESAVLAGRRNDLLWRATGHEEHRGDRDAELERAEGLARGLAAYASSPQERELVAEVTDRVRQFRTKTSIEPPLALETVAPMADGVLFLVQQYLELNSTQMEATIQAALALHSALDRWSVGLVVLVALLLAVGSFGLVRRVVQPTLEVTRAAQRFGSGDPDARARVFRDDELGALARTFNIMADEIVAHQHAQLEFVASVAHDIKSPLVTIGGAARRLRDRPLRPDQQTAWLDRIIIQATRLEHLTHDLMDAAQVATGRLTLATVELDLADLVGSIAREQDEVVGTHTIVLDGCEPCPVIGDRHRLERVVLNLLSNAVKYSPAGTTVRIAVARVRSCAVLTVADEGEGMTPEDLQIAFQPFGRSDRARATTKGTGLGLTVVKAVVAAHDGTIDVRSTPGEGTTVEVTFPAARS